MPRSCIGVSATTTALCLLSALVVLPEDDEGAFLKAVLDDRNFRPLATLGILPSFCRSSSKDKERGKQVIMADRQRRQLQSMAEMRRARKPRSQREIRAGQKLQKGKFKKNSQKLSVSNNLPLSKSIF